MSGSLVRRAAIPVSALLTALLVLVSCGDEMGVAEVQTHAPLPEPDRLPAQPLAAWYQGGFAGKRLVFWGNSTVSNAVYFFDQLNRHAVPGGALEGLNPLQVMNYGSNGASLAALLNGQGAYPVSSVIAAHPDLLVIRGPLINDVRGGRTTLAQAIALLDTALQQIRAASPRTAILLTTENSLLNADPGGQGFVQPAAAAQQYTDILHAAVMAFDGRYPNVEVVDIMAALYGTTSPQTSPWMADQLHPNEAGQRAEAELIIQIIGL